MRRVDSHLLAPVSLSTINQGLLSWQWLRADFGNPILMSAVGDVFFEDSQGQVHRLDPGVGSTQFVAERRGLFDDCGGLPANLDEWFLRPVVEKLISKGLMLGPDQCYGFTTLPIFR